MHDRRQLIAPGRGLSPVEVAHEGDSISVFYLASMGGLCSEKGRKAPRTLHEGKLMARNDLAAKDYWNRILTTGFAPPGVSHKT